MRREAVALLLGLAACPDPPPADPPPDAKRQVPADVDTDARAIYGPPPTDQLDEPVIEPEVKKDEKDPKKGAKTETEAGG